jgi:hypothetical protein
MERNSGYFVEFVIDGRTQFSSVVETTSEDMFMTVWNAAGRRLFNKLAKDADGGQRRGGEFRISPIYP